MPAKQQQRQVRHGEKTPVEIDQRQRAAAEAVNRSRNQACLRRKTENARQQVCGDEIQQRMTDEDHIECPEKWQREKEQIRRMKDRIIRVGEIWLPAMPVHVPQRPFPLARKIEEHLLLRNEIIQQIAKKEGFTEKERAIKEQHAHQHEQVEFFFA